MLGDAFKLSYTAPGPLLSRARAPADSGGVRCERSTRSAIVLGTSGMSDEIGVCKRNQPASLRPWVPRASFLQCGKG
jgi:hypothetical protein